MLLAEDSKPVANPLVMLRETFNDWVVLYDPDSEEGFGIQQVGTFIWRHLDGQNTVQDILTKLRENCDNVPDDGESLIRNFIQDLQETGLAGYQIQKGSIKPDRQHGRKGTGDRVKWAIPALTKIGDSSLNNISAFVPGIDEIASAAGACGCGGSGSVLGPERQSIQRQHRNIGRPTNTGRLTDSRR